MASRKQQPSGVNISSFSESIVVDTAKNAPGENRITNNDVRYRINGTMYLRNPAENFQDPVVLVSSFIVGIVIIMLQNIQIYFIRNKFPRRLRSEKNPLSVLLLNLSIADLLLGTELFLIYVLAALENTIPEGNRVILWVMDVLNEFGSKCTFAVSLQLLLSLAVVKMMTVTANKKFNKSWMKKLCSCVWFLNLAVFAIGYSVHFLNTFSWDITKLWLPILTYLTIFVSAYSFFRIYLVLRKSNRSLSSPEDRTRSFSSKVNEEKEASSGHRQSKHPDPPPRKVGDTFTMIAVIQLSTFILCVAPLATYYALHARPGVDDTISVRVMRLLLLGNPICDSISFFIVFRHLWR